MLSDTTRHLARRLNKQVSRVRDPSSFPTDVLHADQVAPSFLQQVGFPEAADSVAYEPVQRLLAVGTADGRVKVIGRHGVEATIRSGSSSATRYLAFLRHRGALLRVTRGGDVQLFSVAGRRLLASLRVEGDEVNDVAVVPGGPYLLLGCQSGDVRVVSVSGRAGDCDGAGGAAGPAAGLSLQPYQILGEDLGASGGVVALAAARSGDRPLLLVVHRNSGAVVWDVRGERMVCSASDDGGEPSKPTAACWVGARANCFAVGYDDGSVLVYGIPPSALKAAPGRVTASEDCVLVLSLRAAADGAPAAPIRSLTFLPACEGAPGGEDCLLVCGGQAAADPDMLSLLPLEPAGGGPAPKVVPWFGDIKAHTLMCGAGDVAGCDPPQALMVLTEGGQLVVHDLADWHPSPLTLPLQELPPITAARFLPSLGAAQAGEGGAAGVAHAVTFERVWKAYKGAGGGGGGGGGEAWDEAAGAGWPFSGGEPAPASAAAAGVGCHPSALLLTGHRDGRVRVWDSAAAVPRLLATLPSGAAAGQERLRGVTALEACPLSGLLAVGHAGGEVRVFQFCDRPQAARRAVLDESLVPYDTLLAQPAGWQYVLKYSTHAADVTSLALPTRLRLLAVGDAAGGVSVVDLTQPQRLFQLAAAAPGAGAVARLAVGPGEAQPSEQAVLFVASEDSSLSLLALHSGAPAGKALRPKNASLPLDLQLLDEHGVPLPPMHGACALPWADNNAAAPPRSLHMMAASGLGAASGRRAHDPGFDAVAATPQLAAVHSLEVQELPSDDEDDLDAQLAAAAAAAAAQAEADAAAGKARRRSFFRRRSTSPLKTPLAAAPAPPSPATEGDRSGGARPRETDSPPLPDDSPLFPALPSPLTRVTPVPPPSHHDHHQEEEPVDYPYLDAQPESPAAAYVLLAAAHCLRVYSVESARLGDRTTDRKARLDPPAAFAATFLSVRGPGVVSVSRDGILQVHSVPNLTPLLSVPLEDAAALGFPWAAPGAGAAAPAPWACSLDGQLLLTAAGNEVARLAVVRDCALPVGALSTFDWDLSKAAAAAAKMAAAGSTGGGGGGSGAVPDSPAAAPGGRGGSILSQVKGAAAGLVESAAAAGGAVIQELERVRGGGGLLPPRELPSLRALFETPVTSLEVADDELDFLPLDDDEDARGGGGASAAATVAGRAKDMTAAALQGAAQQGAKLTAMLPFGRRTPEPRPESPEAVESADVSRRRELLGAAAPPRPAAAAPRRPAAAPPLPGRTLQRRTMSDIKRTYGSSRAQDARAVAERNREALAVRGEKLANLEEKAAALQGGAQDFASMAQDLESAFANRKWWQL